MTAQQQEPTMREEIVRALADRAAVRAGMQPYADTSWACVRSTWLPEADAVLAVLGRRGDDDAARVRRVRAVARDYDAIAARRDLTDSHRATCKTAADRIRRALDGDDTGSGQPPECTCASPNRCGVHEGMWP